MKSGGVSEGPEFSGVSGVSGDSGVTGISLMITNSGDPNPDSPPSTPEKYSFFIKKNGKLGFLSF